MAKRNGREAAVQRALEDACTATALSRGIRPRLATEPLCLRKPQPSRYICYLAVSCPPSSLDLDVLPSPSPLVHPSQVVPFLAKNRSTSPKLNLGGKSGPIMWSSIDLDTFPIGQSASRSPRTAASPDSPAVEPRLPSQGSQVTDCNDVGSQLDAAFSILLNEDGRRDSDGDADA